MKHIGRSALAGIAVVALIAGLGVTPVRPDQRHFPNPTTTPITHLVVIFQENVSFDHYFATYPVALNPPGEPRFVAAPNTPSVNGLTPGLIANNPNSTKPFRFDRSQAATCDQDHGYHDEQAAYDGGLVDKFVETVGTGPSTSGNLTCNKSDVMGYYDGNTVTAIWNYAQNFAMSDNAFGTTFGPSAPGAVNLVSGNTHGANVTSLLNSFGGTDVIDGTLVGDAQPQFDSCDTRERVGMTNPNIGDLLNTKGISWGWFEGGFANCSASHIGANGLSQVDYIPHHAAFQFFQSTANPNHLPPTSLSMVGQTDQANHNYDITEFFSAVQAGNFPAVSFLKAPGYQDGHAGYSSPLNEQTFLVNTINFLQQTPQWQQTAVIITYDDSDGWYDHVLGPVVNQSNTSQDALNGPGMCGQAPAGSFQGRCGYGPRLPFLVISPWAKGNFVDHTVIDQSSIIKFIEDNWSLPRLGNQATDAIAGSITNMFQFSFPRFGRLILDPNTGEPQFGDGQDH